MFIEGGNLISPKPASVIKIQETSSLLKPDIYKPSAEWINFHQGLENLREYLLESSTKDSNIGTRIYPLQGFKYSINTPTNPQDSKSPMYQNSLIYSSGDFITGPKICFKTIIPDEIKIFSKLIGVRMDRQVIEVGLDARVNLKGGFTRGFIKIPDMHSYLVSGKEITQRVKDFTLESDFRVDRRRLKNILQIAINNFSTLIQELTNLQENSA